MRDLTFLQKSRLYMETHPPYCLILFAILCYGLVFAYLQTSEQLFVISVVVLAAVSVTFLVLVTVATERWWYKEYPDNEWGQRREMMAKLEDSIKQLERKWK